MSPSMEAKLSAFLVILLIAFTPSASETGLIRLDDGSINGFVTFVINVCNKGNQDQAICQTFLTELTTLCSSLSERRRLNLMDLFLTKSVIQVEIAMEAVKEARSGSIGVRDDADLIDCEVMMDSAKHLMVISMEELQGGSLNLKSYGNVHTWLSGILSGYVTCGDGISSGVSKRRIQPQLEELISRARVALAIFISIWPERDVELKMVVDGSWLTDLKKKLQHSDPEVLKRSADVVVAQDGTGDYKTVTEAVEAAPENSKTRYVIHVKKGPYKETIYIGGSKPNITLVGNGRDVTILTGSLSNATGYSTTKSATLAAEGNGFMAQDIWFQNTAGPNGGQDVALRVNADVSVIYRCRIDGYQDTLYAQHKRQFYRDCIIRGTVDFIFGDAAAVFQNCQIEVRKPMSGQTNMLTAQSRQDWRQNSGFSLQKCNITSSSDLTSIKRTVKTFLGRPWREYSRVVVLQSFIDNLIDPAGWAPWKGDIGLFTLFYGEYKNIGPGTDTSKRVKWKGFKVITDPKEAAKFTVEKLLYGELWLNSTGVPYEEGL